MSRLEETSDLRERVFEIGDVVRELTRGRTPLRMSAEEMDLEEQGRAAHRMVSANQRKTSRIAARLASIRATLIRRAAG